MIKKTVASHTARIWIAGDYRSAVEACRSWCMSGACVSVQPVEYVYTMGAESGVVVTIINYARFPADPKQINANAKDLAMHLCDVLHQGSFSIETPDTTTFYSRREADTK